jgi:hypothetical protein
MPCRPPPGAHGTWAMGHGPWVVGRRPRLMPALRMVAASRRSVVGHPWSMVNGQWSVVSGGIPPHSAVACLSNRRQPTRFHILGGHALTQGTSLMVHGPWPVAHG